MHTSKLEDLTRMSVFSGVLAFPSLARYSHGKVSVQTPEKF